MPGLLFPQVICMQGYLTELEHCMLCEHRCGVNRLKDHILIKTDFTSKSNVMKGDLIVFPFPEDPSKDFIKRIVAIGGDTIEIIKKEVFINGKQINESYIIHTDSNTISNRDNIELTKIPKGSFFVMGDNSYDSRF